MLLWTFACFLFPVIFCLMPSADASSSSHKDPYVLYKLESTCLPNRSKRVVKLGTTAAIFYFDEGSIPGDRRHLANGDLNCHLELETSRNGRWGLHVFIEEMELDETGVTGNACRDYVQFGRDVAYITTRTSQQFCGSRSKVYFHNSTSLAPLSKNSSSTQNQRWFIEESDHEIDLWLKIFQNRDPQRGQGPGHPKWRRLKVVVTVFKKNCGHAGNELHYRQCPHSGNKCIRDAYFCDGYANCVWPNGDMASDEYGCDVIRAGGYPGGPSPVRTITGPNIPLIIIVTIVIIIGLAICIVVLQKFYRIFRPADDISDEQHTPVPAAATRAPRGGESGAETSSSALISNPPGGNRGNSASAPPRNDNDELGYSYSPPSYEDAIKCAASSSANPPPSAPLQEGGGGSALSPAAEEDEPPPYSERLGQYTQQQPRP